MESIDEIIPNKELPIKLATAENIETITPPIFAAYCSKNARECIKRISQYKSLAGAIKFLINDEANEMQVSICGEEGAYLLGYQDLNSFFRAFSLWTGKTVTEYKNEILK